MKPLLRICGYPVSYTHLDVYKRQTNNSPGMYNASSGMTTGAGSYSYSVETYIMQKGNDELFKTRWLSFRKDMVNYLSDCPDVAKKIEDKIYRSDDIMQIIDEYNRSCK